MIQGGRSTGTGMGNPGISFDDEKNGKTQRKDFFLYAMGQIQMVPNSSSKKLRVHG